jgi:hypothetical protein
MEIDGGIVPLWGQVQPQFFSNEMRFVTGSAMKVRESILALLLFFVVISTGTITAKASNELVTNGGFENGNAFGWTVVGDIMAARFGHTGTFSLRLGSRGHTGQVSQSFDVPAGVAPTLSFWYLGVPGDLDTEQLIVTLLDQNGGIITQWNGEIDYRWHQVTYRIGVKYAGSRVTVRMFGRPDVAHEIIDLYCPPAPLPCRHRVITYAVYAYIDDVSVSYS